jgi:hypothetical protein
MGSVTFLSPAQRFSLQPAKAALLNTTTKMNGLQYSQPEGPGSIHTEPTIIEYRVGNYPARPLNHLQGDFGGVLNYSG